MEEIKMKVVEMTMLKWWMDGVMRLDGIINDEEV